MKWLGHAFGFCFFFFLLFYGGGGGVDHSAAPYTKQQNNMIKCDLISSLAVKGEFDYLCILFDVKMF